MRPWPGDWVAIGHAVVYYTRTAHACIKLQELNVVTVSSTAVRPYKYQKESRTRVYPYP